MTTPSEHKLVRYQNDNYVKTETKKPNEPPKDAEKTSGCFGCCVSNQPKDIPKPRRKHSRQFTQHEIDYTVMLRGQEALKKNPSTKHVVIQAPTDGKYLTNERKT